MVRHTYENFGFFDTLRPLAFFHLCHCRGFAGFFLTYGGTSYVRKLRLFLGGYTGASCNVPLVSSPRLRKFFFDVRWYVIRTKTSAFSDTLRPLAMFLLCHCRGFASFFFDVRWYVIRTKTSAFFLGGTLGPLAMFHLCHCRGFASFFLTYGGTSYVRKLRLFF